MCGPGEVYDFVAMKCIVKDNNTLGICPPTKPYWNSATIRCEVCPPAYPIYNAQLGRC